MVSVKNDPNAPESHLDRLKAQENGFFSLRPIQPEVANQVTPRSGSHDESAAKMHTRGTSSQYYQSAKVKTNSEVTLIEKDPTQTAHKSNNQFDHQQELKDLQGQRIDDHTFGNVNSKRSLHENDELFKGNEACNG